MNVLQINTVYQKGSTGKIAKGIQEECAANNINCYVAYRYREGATYENTIEVSSYLDCHAHNRIAKITNLGGFFSAIHTLLFLHRIKKLKIDLIHLHNLHGNYINIPLLFRYIKRKSIPVVWTLHDCWAFTGGCAYYTYNKCFEWKKDCDKCIYQNNGIWNVGNMSKFILKKKKIWFSNICNMTIVTPSKWLQNEVNSSFLRVYPSMVINNGIDLCVFHPKDKNPLTSISEEGKYIVLGVAYVWEHRKGLDVFIELSNRLDPEKYKIVLVGVDNKLSDLLPSNIVTIERTANQCELADIYSQADVFVNPTREDNFPTVNLEAIACGTPVITFDSGGSAEMICQQVGMAIHNENMNDLVNSITDFCENNKYSAIDISNNAEKYSQDIAYGSYVELYRKVCGA